MSELNVVRTPIQVKGPKTDDGRTLLEDYGFCFISINGVGGVTLSDEYIKNEDFINDSPGAKSYYSSPVLRNCNSYLEDEAFGFV